MAVSTVAAGPAFVVVYPAGMELGAAAGALDRAGIAHRAARFPYAATPAAADVVYLIDEARLLSLGSRAVVEQALELIAETQPACTIVVAERGSPNAWLAESPQVAGWLVAPLEPAALVVAVRTAAAALAARAELRAAHGESEHLLRVGLALSAERDITKLHQSIVHSARELTKADSGSLFLLEDGEQGERVLRFAVAQTGPTDAGTYLGLALPLSRTSISGYVALSGEVLRIPDAYAIPESAEYRFNPSFDKANNYRTTSVLCVPMRDHDETIVGVIQLINRKPEFELRLESPEQTLTVVEPFSARDERVLLSLASQAGVALENKALLDSIQDLFEQFVRASVKAIEVRDKSTQGHSSRVAELTVLQAEAVNAAGGGVFAGLAFDADQLREMRYASLLHDFGKVAVPEYIFGKAKKLPDGKLDTVRLRFLLAAEQVEKRAAFELFELMREGVPPGDPRFAAIEERRSTAAAQIRDLLAAVENANEPRVVAGEVAEVLAQISGMRYEDVDGERPLLEDAELDYLRIPRGSLSGDERRKMEQHVTQSFYFLREIPWTKTPWGNVPNFAYGHHEHLDGTGYPRGLKGSEIAPQVRMLTISDVFDALTANDRPYKPAMPIERALDILVKEFAERGKVDRDFLELFIAKKVYEPVMAGRASS